MLRSLVVVAMLASAALAQPAPSDTPPQPAETPTPPEEPPAVRAFEEGRTLLDAGKPGDACAKFEESIKLDPDAPGTMLNLGLCNELLGRTATALHWFRKAQFRAAESNKTDYEQAAKGKTVLLAGKVPSVRIVFSSPPPAGASYVLDGQTVTDVELAHLEVDPTSHTFEVRVPTGKPLRTEFSIKDGESKVVTVVVPRTIKKVIVVDRGAPQRYTAYAIGGGGLLLYAASAGLSLYAKHEYDAAEHPEDLQHWKNVARFGGTSLFVGGTAALAVAAYLYVRAPAPEKFERIEQTAIAPVIGDHQLGVAVAGSF